MGVYIQGGYATQGPAPDGFHVPLTTERKAVYDVWTALGGGSSDGTNFGIALKLPFTGYRYRSSADVNVQGSIGYYWSSSRNDTNFASRLSFSSTVLYPQNNGLIADGLSVRCFKNSPTIPTSSWTKLYGTSIEAGGIFWNTTDGLISLSSDGTTWITIADKNLGATTVWNSGDTLSEANCGKYYQRGNNYGFPRTGTIANQSTTQVDASNYGPGNYYSSSTFITYNGAWDTTDNGNLRGGEDGNVPTMSELKNAYIGEYRVPCTITGSTLVSSKQTFDEGSDVQGMYISPDGTKMYVDFWSNKRLYQYTLSTPRDVATATSVRYISVTAPDGIYFDDTGTYMFIGCETDHSIKRYTLSTPRDISTATQDQSLSLGTNYIFSVSLSEDGKYIYYGRYYSGDKLWSYELTTPYNLNTATNSKSVSLGTSILGIYVRNNGKYLYVRGEISNKNVWQYELSTPYDITSNRTQIGIFDAGSGDVRGFWVSSDCKYWAVDYGSTSTGQGIKLYQSIKL